VTAKVARQGFVRIFDSESGSAREMVFAMWIDRERSGREGAGWDSTRQMRER
jgi:hypothetical protein